MLQVLLQTSPPSINDRRLRVAHHEQIAKLEAREWCDKSLHFQLICEVKHELIVIEDIQQRTIDLAEFGENRLRISIATNALEQASADKLKRWQHFSHMRASFCGEQKGQERVRAARKPADAEASTVLCSSIALSVRASAPCTMSR